MAQMCRPILERDEFLAKIIPPRLNGIAKKNMRYSFVPKLDFLTAESHIAESEASLLRLGHAYRNPAIYQGRYNPGAMRTLSVILFQSISTLLQKAFEGVSIGGVGEIARIRSFLRPFGVGTEG